LGLRERLRSRYPVVERLQHGCGELDSPLREVRLMHTGGDVEASRRAFFTVAYDELGARGVAWG